MKVFADLLQAATSDKRKAAVCIVVKTHGSSPRKEGAKMIVYEDGTIVATIGGGKLEEQVIKDAIKAIKTGKAQLKKHELLQQHGMCCGGSVEIYIEPIMKNKKLFIFGAGHIGRALAFLGQTLDFDITMIDDRKEYLDQIKIPAISKLPFDPLKTLPSISFDSDSFIIIATYNHQLDRDILAYCIKQPHAYLGMIGSLRKVAITKKLFLEGKIADNKALDQIDMPMGINIQAESPEEIAISILAKIIAVKNNTANE